MTSGLTYLALAYPACAQAPAPVAEPAGYAVVSMQLLNALYTELAARPYSETAGLIQKMQQEVSNQPKPAPSVAPEQPKQAPAAPEPAAPGVP